MTGSDWTECSLGDVITFQRGYDITKKEQRPGPFNVVSSSGPSSKHDTFTAAGPGVIIGRKGTLGTVFYESGPYWAHDTTLWVRDFRGNSPRFIYYLLRTMGLQRYDVGASNPTLNRNHLHPLPVRVPPRPTQVRIAEVLSAYDDLIAVNQRRVAILEEMARRQFEEWFVRFRFPNHEREALAETELGLGPRGWPPITAASLIAFDPRTPVPKEGEKYFVPMGALSTDSMVIDGWEQRIGNAGSKFQNGDTLLARITPCLENGKTAYVDFLPFGATAFGSTEYIVMRGRQAPSTYVYFLARSQKFRDTAIKSMGGADGRQRARSGALEGFKLLRPPDALLAAFDEAASPMFKLIRVLADQNTRLRSARDLLLPKLISGEIEVGKAELALEDAA